MVQYPIELENLEKKNESWALGKILKIFCDSDEAQK